MQLAKRSTCVCAMGRVGPVYLQDQAKATMGDEEPEG